MTSNAQSAALMGAADQLMQAGRLDEAAGAWEQVLALEPGNPRALLHLGQHMLHRRQLPRSLELLQRAVAADRANPVAALNLAFAFRAQGDAVREMDALVRALTIDPYFVPALLARAALFERVGRPRLAAKTYNDVLTILPPGVKVEPWLEDALARARKSVEDNRAAITAQLKPGLEAVKTQFPQNDTARFEEARDIMIGTKKPMPSQPTLLAYPRLPAVPFYDRADFPWLKTVEDATPAIQAELAALMQDGAADFAPYVRHPDGVPLNQWAALNRSPDWSAYFLFQDGKPLEDHCRRCPQTAALVKTLPLAEDSRHRARRVFFRAEAQDPDPAAYRRHQYAAGGAPAAGGAGWLLVPGGQ